jgi:hypothetical protein
MIREKDKGNLCGRMEEYMTEHGRMASSMEKENS